MRSKKIEVNMGDGLVTRAPDVVSSMGLGSCVVLTLYDKKLRIGGLAHIMLPDSESINGYHFPYQFADTAIDALLKELQQKGAQKQNMVAKIAGGAQMFSSMKNSEKGIGEQNIKSIINILNRENIVLKGEDTGGHHGRNVEFYLNTGKLIVKSIDKKKREFERKWKVIANN